MAHMFDTTDFKLSPIGNFVIVYGCRLMATNMLTRGAVSFRQGYVPISHDGFLRITHVSQQRFCTNESTIPFLWTIVRFPGTFFVDLVFRRLSWVSSS